MKISSTEVNLKAVYYAAVGPNMPGKNFAWFAPDVHTLPEGGKTRFAEYFCHVFNTEGRSDTRYTAQAVEKSHRNYRMDKFKKLLRNFMNKQSFEAECKDLTEIFQVLIHPAAPDGILFLIIFELDKIQYLCNLKLETSPEGVLYVVKNLVKYDDFDEALPRAKDMQKGSIYPHPSGPRNSLKVLQEDGHAEYFDAFLGAYRAKSTADTARFLLHSPKTVREKKLNYDETMNVVDAMHELVKTESVILNQSQLIDTLIASVDFPDEAEARKKLRELTSKRSIYAGELIKSEVENLKVKIDIGNIRIQGTRRAIKKQVTYSEEGEVLIVSVKGATFNSTAGSRL